MNSNDLVIDNFAGGGGASLGIEQAMGRPVDIAVNHDPVAIAMHKMNHSDTMHLCESVWDVNPKEVCKGREVGLAWFSPDCKHFSKAKGGKPVEKKIRGLAWIVLKWAKAVKPKVIMLENVTEFLTWGPLIMKDGKAFPCPDRKGKTYDAFVNALKRQGYDVDWKTLRACDYGAPTIRKRLFMVARCDGLPIVWPEPTHAHPESLEVKAGIMKPFRTAAECIEWDKLCPSIFERKKPLAENTQRRIAKGIMKYVVNSPDPFIVTYYGPKKEDDFRGQPLSEPLRTQTTENRHALVMPSLVDVAHGELGKNGIKRWGHGHHSLNKPLKTVVSSGNQALVSAFLAKHYTGVTGSKLKDPIGTVTSIDHHSLVAASLVRNMGQSVGSDLKEPARTVLTQEKDALVTSHIMKMKGTNIGHGTDEPLHTVTASGLHFGEVRAFLLKYYGTDQDPRLKDPLHTITSKDRFGLVTVRGEKYKIVDVGLRMLSPRELFRAQGFPDSYIIDRDTEGNKITKTHQVAKCGNSVCPDLARVLVEANVVNIAAQDKENIA